MTKNKPFSLFDFELIYSLATEPILALINFKKAKLLIN
jgi:hypothetical protein